MPRKADPALDLSCHGILGLEQIGGMLVAREDPGMGSSAKWVKARCPACGWTGEIPYARAVRAGSGNVRCKHTPFDGDSDDA